MIPTTSLLAPAGRAATALGEHLKRWATARKDAAEDRQIWKLALTDPRVMAEITRDVSVDTAGKYFIVRHGSSLKER